MGGQQGKCLNFTPEMFLIHEIVLLHCYLKKKKQKKQRLRSRKTIGHTQPSFLGQCVGENISTNKGHIGNMYSGQTTKTF